MENAIVTRKAEPSRMQRVVSSSCFQTKLRNLGALSHFFGGLNTKVAYLLRVPLWLKRKVGASIGASSTGFLPKAQAQWTGLDCPSSRLKAHQGSMSSLTSVCRVLSPPDGGLVIDVTHAGRCAVTSAHIRCTLGSQRSCAFTGNLCRLLLLYVWIGHIWIAKQWTWLSMPSRGPLYA